MNDSKKENKVITYSISKVKNSDEMYISVQNGEVEIIAPNNFTNKEIQKVISEKSDWILKKIAEYNFKTKNESNGIERNPVKILGKEYKVKINYKKIKVAELNVEENEINITLSNKYKGKDNKKILNLAIEKMYESIAKDEIERAMEKTRILLGIAPDDYNIKKLKTGYGMCSKKIITIDPSIIKFDKETIDYIVLEQFLKLKYKATSKKYKEALELYLNQPYLKIIEI